MDKKTSKIVTLIFAQSLNAKKPLTKGQGLFLTSNG